MLMKQETQTAWVYINSRTIQIAMARMGTKYGILPCIKMLRFWSRSSPESSKKTTQMVGVQLESNRDGESDIVDKLTSRCRGV